MENSLVPAGLLHSPQENTLAALRANLCGCRGVRGQTGSPGSPGNPLGVGIPGKGSAEPQPSLHLSALLSVSPGLNSLLLLHQKFYCHLNYDDGSSEQRKQNAITGCNNA